MTWTQPICTDCWDAAHPDNPAPRNAPGEAERCAFCGRMTMTGIYVRADPTTVPYPREEA